MKVMALTEAQKKTIETVADFSRSPGNAVFRAQADSKVPEGQSADYYQGLMEMAEAVLNILHAGHPNAVTEKVVISLAGVAAERLLDAFPATIEPNDEVKE